jgi:hypothetical protein
MESIVISVDVLETLRARKAVIDQYTHILNCLELEMKMQVQALTGADVVREDWSLDLTRGVLERVASTDINGQ